MAFAIDQLPDTSYARDFETLLNAGTLAYGIRALYRKPPPEVVSPIEAEEEIEDTADDAEPGVTIGAINQAILTGLAIIPVRRVATLATLRGRRQRCRRKAWPRRGQCRS